MLTEAVDAFVVVKRFKCLLDGVAVGALHLDGRERASLLVFLKDLLPVLVKEGDGSCLFRYNRLDFGGEDVYIAARFRNSVFRSAIDRKDHKTRVLRESVVGRCRYTDDLIVDDFQSHIAVRRVDHNSVFHGSISCGDCPLGKHRRQ